MQLTIEQIKKLNTKRLLSLFRIEKSILDGNYNWSHKRITFKERNSMSHKKYVELLKDELNKREHVVRA